MAKSQQSVSLIGKTIKRIRMQKEMSQVALSNKAGLTNSYIGNLENGFIRNPPLDSLISIAKALEVTYGALLAPLPEDIEQQKPDLPVQTIEALPSQFSAIINLEDLKILDTYTFNEFWKILGQLYLNDKIVFRDITLNNKKCLYNKK